MFSRRSIWNSVWLALEKLYIAGMVYGVTLLIAKRLGAESFGIYMYSLSVVTLIGSIVLFVDERVVKKERIDSASDSVFVIAGFIRISLALLAILLGGITYFLHESTIQGELFLYFLLLLNIFIAAMQYKYQVKLEFDLMSKLYVFYGIIGTSVGTVVQLYGVLVAESLTVLAVGALSGNIAKTVLLMRYGARRKLFEFSSAKKLGRVERGLLSRSFPLALAALAYTGYMKTDQIMLGNMLGVESVGVYALSMQFTMLTLVLLVPLQTSLFPDFAKLVYLNQHEKQYLLVTSRVTWFSIFLVILVYCSLLILFPIVYGEQYRDVLEILPVQLCTAVFFYNAMLRAGYLVIIGKSVILVYVQVGAFIMNILLNYILIAKIGLLGAAVSSLITILFSLLFSNAFFKSLHFVGEMQLRAFNPKNMFRGKV